MLSKSPNFKSLLGIGSSLLYPSPSNSLDALLILEKVTNIKREMIIAHQYDKIDSNIKAPFYLLIGKRKRGIPLAYLLGNKEFFGLNYFVNKSVLIPRPETESLVELALEILKNRKTGKIIDLGTGSGCIAISIAKYCNNQIEIEAIDNSREALKVAKNNALRILGTKTKIKFKEFDYIKESLIDKYDLIIVNPPYVDFDERPKLSVEISFEPEQAIFAKQNGLEYYYFLKELLKKNLKKKGLALIEIGTQSKQVLKKIFKDDFKIEIKKDLNCKDRILIISPLL